MEEEVLKLYGVVNQPWRLAGYAADYVAWATTRWMASEKARHSAEITAWRAVKEAIGNSAIIAARKAALEATGKSAPTEPISASHRATGKSATDEMKVAMDAEVKVKNVDYRMVGVSAAKAAWKYVIANEETITTAISKLVRVTITRTFDREKVFNLLLLDQADLKEMIPAAKCWYFARVYRIISLDSPREKKFLECISQHGSMVVEFVEWTIGAKYSLLDLQELCAKIGCPLLPVLVSIVYDFLAPPTREKVKERLLSLL